MNKKYIVGISKYTDIIYCVIFLTIKQNYIEHNYL